jgi:hypothetical protein
MEATPSTTARLVAAAARTRSPEQEAGNGGDRLTTDPADRRKRANAALLELFVTRATRRG